MKTVLTALADNPELTKAFRALLEEEFSLDEILTTMSNEKMGEVIRARIEGLKKIDRVFKKLEQHRSVKERVPGVNPAR